MGASCLRINQGTLDQMKNSWSYKSCKKQWLLDRIGINAGSLDKKLLEKYKEPCPEALVESAKHNIKMLEDNDFFNFKISVKSSDIFLTVKAYKQLSKICDYPCILAWLKLGVYLQEV